MTVNVWPATAIEPVRTLEVALVDTEYVTVPLPVPLAALLMVMNELVQTAVQSQSLKLGVIFTVLVPPAALNFPSFGLSENVQPPRS